MQKLTHSLTQREPSAASVFLSGLPEPRHGRILTCGSDIDCHKRKPLAVIERLRRERIERAWSAPL